MLQLLGHHHNRAEEEKKRMVMGLEKEIILTFTWKGYGNHDKLVVTTDTS